MSRWAAVLAITTALVALIVAEQASDAFAGATAGHPITVNAGFAVATLILTYAVLDVLLRRRSLRSAKTVTGWALRDFVNGMAEALDLARRRAEPNGQWNREAFRAAVARAHKELMAWQPTFVSAPELAQLFGRALGVHDVVLQLGLSRMDPDAARDHHTPHGFRQNWSWARRELEEIVTAAADIADYAGELLDFVGKESFNPDWYDPAARRSRFYVDRRF